MTPAQQLRHNWVLYAFIFLLPLQNIQVGYMPKLGAGLNFLNVFFGLSLIGAFMVRGKLARGESVNFWVGAFALHSLLSMFIGYQFVGSGTEIHFNTLKDQLTGLFVVYLVQMSVTDWEHVRRMILATVLPMPYIGWVVWNQHRSVAGWHYSDDLRISGTFAMLGANEMAAFCVTGALMLFAFLLSARLPKWWKWGMLAAGAAMVTGVMYAYSRTGYITLLLGMATIALVWRNRARLVIPLVFAAAFLPAVMPASVMERFNQTSVEEGERDESTELRFEYWDIAWRTFTTHPIVGTGYHTFHHREINPHGTDTHNLYMRTLSEGGILGISVLVALLLSVLFTALRNVGNAEGGSMRYALALGLIGAWSAVVCSNIFGDRFTYYPMIAHFWVYVGLMLKSQQLPREASLR